MLARAVNPNWDNAEIQYDSQGNSLATGVQQSPVDGESLEQNESSTDRVGAVLDHDQPCNKSKGKRRVVNREEMGMDVRSH